MSDAGDLADQYAAMFNERATPITGDDMRRAAAHITAGGGRSDLGPSLVVTVERLVNVVAGLTVRVASLESDRAEVVSDE